MRARDYAWVALGGMAGASARMGAGVLFDGVAIPWGMLLANVLGTLLLALVSIASRRLRPTSRAFLGTGFCGAFTTVSSLGAHVAGQIMEGAYASGLGYLGLSLGMALPMAIWVLRWHPPEEVGA